MHKESILVQRVKSGDHKAFKELFDNNVIPLYRFMSQFTSDKQQVDDWVQRAFIKSYENINRFEGISLFATWLFRIAINEMRTDFRRNKLIQYSDFEDDNFFPDEMDDIDLEWNKVMKEWLFELSEIKRMVFVLFEVEGYSHSEISTMLGIKESTSRTILTRTKKWLQSKWKEEEKIK